MNRIFKVSNIFTTSASTSRGNARMWATILFTLFRKWAIFECERHLSFSELFLEFICVEYKDFDMERFVEDAQISADVDRKLDDEDDFFSFDLDNYQETNYWEIVLDLAEDCFGYGDSNSQQVDVCFRCDECENPRVSCDRKVELEAVGDCLDRKLESCEEQFDPDNDDRDDFFDCDLESYQETNYSDIVLDLSEDCFGYSDSHWRQVDKNECENHHQKVELEAVRHCLDRVADVNASQSKEHAPEGWKIP
ncbi:uncharacterized protein LOC111629918 isoform X2 [Centruroides sculpturatus]|uniref:uncharacterized protein LOC111629918 isoform X2 n=1 Tax=Centruroides sculpturatus TaxID=218467 RepID=UPI000C6D8BEE|nr:uncharacterized protein LOC111629918 isoform X2 [Centruroides sculpturatus]